MLLEELIRFARGEAEVDLLLKNAQLVNVYSGQIHRADVAVQQDRIVGLGDYRARQVIDLQGQYLSPGFIDGHMHIESAMLRVSEFARVVVHPIQRVRHVAFLRSGYRYGDRWLQAQR
jgi:adenine deaminase